MIKIGVCQIKNSIEVESNFISIMQSLKIFQNTDTDIILFPECSLSGFSAKIKDCTLDLMSDYFAKIEKWSKDHNKYVVLPTALDDGKIYNTGFVFGGIDREQFYKIVFSESEKKFFSTLEKNTKKIFSIKKYNIAILLCLEAEMHPYLFFAKGDADLILWPGYWRWQREDKWEEFKKDGNPNLIFKNMNEWKIPLIQSNFAFNDIADERNAGPHGLSMFVNKDNSLFFQADFNKESCYQITVENQKITRCLKLGCL